VSDYLSVVPAYGRDYKSKKAVMADWEEGKDFYIVSLRIVGGHYVNINDKPEGTILQVRYDRNRKVMLIP
jgi:hypothetical protein